LRVEQPSAQFCTERCITRFENKEGAARSGDATRLGALAAGVDPLEGDERPSGH
jgi:hypothetical protein